MGQSRFDNQKGNSPFIGISSDNAQLRNECPLMETPRDNDNKRNIYKQHFAASITFFNSQSRKNKSFFYS